MKEGDHYASISPRNILRTFNCHWIHFCTKKVCPNIPSLIENRVGDVRTHLKGQKHCEKAVKTRWNRKKRQKKNIKTIENYFRKGYR